MSVHHGHRLKSLIEKKKGNIAQIAVNLNVARGTLYNYFEQEEIPKKKLLKVCVAAGIDINEVLDELEMQEPAADYMLLQERVRSLEQMIPGSHTKEYKHCSHQVNEIPGNRTYRQCRHIEKLKLPVETGGKPNCHCMRNYYNLIKLKLIPTPA